MSTSKLKEASDSASSAIGSAAGSARDYAKHASEGVQHTAKQAADPSAARAMTRPERFDQRNGRENLMLVCFGVGLIVGALVVVLSSRFR